MNTSCPVQIDVTIIVPCRNEQRFVSNFLQSLLAQDLTGITWEVLIADGMSDDDTRAIIATYCQKYPVRILDNPQQVVSTGLNQAIAEARGRYILRMDVHTTYASDYVRQCLRVADDTGADNVGGPWVPVGEGYIGTAIAAAFQSSFGTGMAKGHDPTYEGPVDTVYLGCWPRDVFSRIGLFDAQLVRNQDDEFNLRLRRIGAQVWQSPEIVSFYHPRSSLHALFRQYMQYGYWKVAVIRKHRLSASFRHVVPGIFVAVNGILFLTYFSFWITGLSHLSFAALFSWMAISGAYLAFCLVASFAAAGRHGWSLLPVLPLVFATYHFGYGYGFLLGVVHLFRNERSGIPNPAFTELTR
jgi:succinoglycan biosynthesis protein ExoA